jgi:hypothetical protein
MIHDIISVTTAPELLSTVNRTSDSVLLTWFPPREHKECVHHYKVCFREMPEARGGIVSRFMFAILLLFHFSVEHRTLKQFYPPPHPPTPGNPPLTNKHNFFHFFKCILYVKSGFKPTFSK